MSGRRITAGIAAIIQARMGSTRLPGKTLADICGKPLLARVIERVRASRTVQRTVLATTTDAADNVLVELARRNNSGTYRGSVNDVLDRYYQTAREFDADIVVRVTGDDPFKDPEVIDRIVGRFLEDDSMDYVSNTLKPSYPEGLDIEVFSFEALEKAWMEASLNSDREHVTPYIWRHPERFRTLNVEYHRDLSHLRWTLDYDQDLRFAREVYARLNPNGMFLMNDILTLLEREPELIAINSGIKRNEGWLRSLDADLLLADQRL